MTNCIGGPPVEPGSAGGEKASTCAVGTSRNFGPIAGSTCFWPRSRWSQGFNSTPAKPARTPLRAVDDEEHARIRG